MFFTFSSDDSPQNKKSKIEEKKHKKHKKEHKKKSKKEHKKKHKKKHKSESDEICKKSEINSATIQIDDDLSTEESTSLVPSSIAIGDIFSKLVCKTTTVGAVKDANENGSLKSKLLEKKIKSTSLTDPDFLVSIIKKSIDPIKQMTPVDVLSSDTESEG